jgi:hypothetical protein
MTDLIWLIVGCGGVKGGELIISVDEFINHIYDK